MTNRCLANVAYVLVLGLASHLALAQSPVAKPAVPLDPVTAIIDAFKSFPIVALGEGAHGNEQSYAFRLTLLRDSRFAATVNDIVVESGNSRYQEVMDRYVSGESVPYSELRQVWENTYAAGTVWDRPIYAGYFSAVRQLNANVPQARRLRVLLGDLPMDWGSVHTWADYSKIRRDDSVPAAIIQREVIARGRRALVVYGDAHFWRKNLYFPLTNEAFADERFARPNQSLVTRLEQAGTRVFSIQTSAGGVDLSALQPDIAGWSPPKLAMLRDSLLGRTSSAVLQLGDLWVMIDRAKGLEERTRADPQRSPLITEQFDALLYLGPPSAMTESKVSPALCSDQEYMKMRLQRIAIASPQDANPGASLKAYCEAVPAAHAN